MKSFFIPLLPILALAWGLGGCEKTPRPPDDKLLFQAVEDNAKAVNQRDVDAAMATFHPKAPDFAGLREFLAQTFHNVELKVALSDLQVVTVSPEEARVRFTLKTDQVTKDGVVPLNIVEGVDTLRPDNGTWKIYSTLQTKVTRLSQPAPDSTADNLPASQSPNTPTATAPALPDANPEPAVPPIGAGPKPATPAPPASPAEKPLP